VLPLIQEEPFRPFYCPDNGRPNVPVAILTGLCILKELHNLTDQEVLGSLEFDLRFQHVPSDPPAAFYPGHRGIPETSGKTLS